MLFQRAPQLFFGILIISLALGLLGLAPGLYEGFGEWFLFVVLVLATGLPHGATDHVLHAFTCRQQRRPVRWAPFFVQYLGAIALFSAAWLLAPTFSLLVFLGVSAYHFGQSQLLYIDLPERHPLKWFLYMSWGGAWLLGLLWVHRQEAATILQPVLGVDHPIWLFFIRHGHWVAAGLAVGVGAGWITAVLRQRMPLRALVAEGVVALLLVWIMHVTPLIVAFSIYFGLWHALSSMTEEIQRLRIQQPQFGFKDFYLHAWPFTLLSIVGIGILIAASIYFRGAFSPYLLFFIAISALTMPHIVAIGRFYALPYRPSSTAR